MSTRSVYSRIILRSQKLISEGIVILDANKKNQPIIFMNKGFKKITGYKSSDLIGKGIKFFQNDKSSDSNLKKFKESIEDKKNRTTDLYLKKSNEQLCFCRISISFIKDESNPVGYFLLIVRDITEIRKGLINELKLDVVRATLRSVNDIVLNYMQGLQLFRHDCENHCSSSKIRFDIFDKQYNNTLDKLKQINELQEFKEKRIGGSDSKFKVLSPE